MSPSMWSTVIGCALRTDGHRSSRTPRSCPRGRRARAAYGICVPSAACSTAAVWRSIRCVGDVGQGDRAEVAAGHRRRAWRRGRSRSSSPPVLAQAATRQGGQRRARPIHRPGCMCVAASSSPLGAQLPAAPAVASSGSAFVDVRRRSPRLRLLPWARSAGRAPGSTNRLTMAEVTSPPTRTTRPSGARISWPAMSPKRMHGQETPRRSRPSVITIGGTARCAPRGDQVERRAARRSSVRSRRYRSSERHVWRTRERRARRAARRRWPG